MSIIFKDRTPTRPNRYLVTPEDGSNPYHVVLARADDPTENGTPLNAETFNNMVEHFDKECENLEKNKLSVEDQPAVIEEALAAAKASGAFDGANGSDGVSPTVAVAKISGGNRITITDASGPKSVDVMDGSAGRGIISITRTAGTGAAGTVDTYTILYTDNTTSGFNVYNGANGTSGGGSGGGSGADGATFTPYVDSNGNLSWSNNQGLPNPETVNIKGPKGDPGSNGAKGDKGDKGDAGASPVRGTDYWTAADIAQIKSYVDNAILGGAW